MWEKMCINGLIFKLITIASCTNRLFGSGRFDGFVVGGDRSLSIVDAQRAKLDLSSKPQHPSAASSHNLEYLDDPFGWVSVRCSEEFGRELTKLGRKDPQQAVSPQGSSLMCLVIM